MEKVVNVIKQSDEDLQGMLFWLNKTSTERIEEVTRLRINYYTWLNKSYPEKIEKVVSHRSL